jgi:phosphomevalonate kinase
MTTYAAPGKAVIWGEYAVLAGAPALVMAVDRFASATILPGDDLWRITARGFEGKERIAAAELLRRRPDLDEDPGPADLIRCVIAALGVTNLPAAAEIVTDTRAFHARGTKLGIGSSAAICTATCAALADFLEVTFNSDKALAAHRLLQGASGSGLDVAAACHGGLIRFQNGSAAEAAWPAELQFRFVWSGQAAKTTAQVAKFSTWQATGQTAPLDALCAASEALFENPSLAGLRDYVARLKNLDENAHLGIYDSAHRRLDELANRAQVVYKPCGAGGGDIGIALSDDISSLERFIASAAHEQFETTDLEIAAHGVHRIRK